MEPTTNVSRRKAGGFALVEVLICIMVLTFSALIFVAAFPTSQISRVKAVHMSYATGLAQQVIEDKRSAGYANVIPCTETSIPLLLPDAEQTTTITQVSENVREIDVTITWGGYRMAGGAVHMATLISDHS